MITLASKSTVSQNLGLFDRVFRLVAGAALIGVSYHLHTNVGMALHTWGGSYAIAIALYPIFTGLFGWDPLYAMMHARTCNASGRNQCGTLPYQIKAMMGRAPGYCETDTEHSLESCHDGSAEHPRHKVWKVDAEPEIYPDDKAWQRFSTRQHNKF